MLMFGAQKSKPSWARLRPARSNCARLMRASMPMAMAMRWMASVSNVDARPTDSVQRFAPPIVGGYVQPLDGTRLIGQLGDLFFQGHAMYQVGGPLLGRQRRVQIWRQLRILGV